MAKRPGSPDLALGVLCVGMLMIILDQTIVTVALPTIATDLGFSPSGLAWVVNAYLVPFGGVLLLAGRLGDLLGRRRTFLVGLSVFTAASVACGLAGSAGVLVAARFVQGLGGGLASSVILGMVVALYPEPRAQARAIAVYGFVGAAGASIGLLAGGVLTEALSWHWTFLVNVPFGLAAVVLASRLVADDAGLGLARGADVPGAVLVTAGIMLGVVALVGAADHGWMSGRTLGGGALALALLAGFVARQATAATPLVPLRLFRDRDLSGANLAQALMVAGMFGFQLLAALHLQRVLGWSPSGVGFAMAPVALVIGAVSLTLTARLIGGLGARSVLLAGLVTLVAGLGVLARVPVDARYVVDVLPALLLLGVGAGLALPAVTTLAMAGAPPADAGLASGLVNTTQQVGGALGLAVLASLATARTDRSLAAGHATAQAVTDGHRLGFAVAAGLVAAAAVVTATVLRRPPVEQPAGAPSTCPA
jgi:EmrB/QacA subfamily drug resistance transporter